MAYYPANYRYDKENRVKVTVGFNRRTEPELTDWIEKHENKAGYLKRLAEDDMKRAETEENK